MKTTKKNECPYCRCVHKLPDDLYGYFSKNVRCGNVLGSNIWIVKNLNQYCLCPVDNDSYFWHVLSINYCPICGRRLQ